MSASVPAGCFVAPGAAEVYAHVAAEEGLFKTSEGIRIFEEFMSLRGPRAYGIRPSRNKIRFSRTMEREPDTNTVLLPEMGDQIVPLFSPELGFAPPVGCWWKTERVVNQTT